MGGISVRSKSTNATKLESSQAESTDSLPQNYSVGVLGLLLVGTSVAKRKKVGHSVSSHRAIPQDSSGMIRVQSAVPTHLGSGSVMSRGATRVRQ